MDWVMSNPGLFMNPLAAGVAAFTLSTTGLIVIVVGTPQGSGLPGPQFHCQDRMAPLTS